MAAQALKLARITQKLDQLLYVFLRLVTAGDIRKSGFDLILGQHARLALAKAHRAAAATAAALHLAHEEHEDGDNDQDRETGNQQLSPDALLLGLLALDDDVVVEQIADQAIILNRRAHGFEGLTTALAPGDDIAIHRHPLDLAVLYQIKELGVIQRIRFLGTTEVVHHRDQYGGNDQPQDEVLRHIVQFTTLLLPAPLREPC